MSKTSTSPKSMDRRILVLGSSNHTKLITAYEWDKLPTKLTVSDFDTVVLNFTPFQDENFAKHINIDLMPNWQQFARHLFSKDSEIIAIGSPQFLLGNNPYLPSTWWLPVELNFIYENGVEIRKIDPIFEFYFAFVNNWSFYLEHVTEKMPDFTVRYLQLSNSALDSFRTKISNLAETRFNRPIGFKLCFELLKNTHRMSQQYELIKSSGLVYWLPEPTEIEISEAIDQILQYRYAIQFERIPPQWVEMFHLPAQQPILNEIHKKERLIGELEKQLQDERQKFMRASQFLKLLYEQGEVVLEPVVRDALRELGAFVEDPGIKGREDGRLVDPFTRNGMLEIKGRVGDLKLSDVRELDNWVRDAVANENWHSKGLLIANLQCNEDPRKRTNPFPKNCVDTAKIFDISILTTTQLFQALVSDQMGKLDRKAFWDQIFSTKGVCNLPELS